VTFSSTTTTTHTHTDYVVLQLHNYYTNAPKYYAIRTEPLLSCVH